jgi:hypothetical protein
METRGQELQKVDSSSKTGLIFGKGSDYSKAIVSWYSSRLLARKKKKERKKREYWHSPD